MPKVTSANAWKFWPNRYGKRPKYRRRSKGIKLSDKLTRLADNLLAVALCTF